jgi:uncharacterized protein
MEFDTYTVALLVTNPDAPEYSEAERDRLQDAHLSHLAELYDAGHLVAVGPLSDPDGELRGLSILRVDPERARELKEVDPAVQAGIFLLRIMPWTFPAGLVQFTPGRLPRSMAEVRD